jgi:hypothetical protein
LAVSINQAEFKIIRQKAIEKKLIAGNLEFESDPETAIDSEIIRKLNNNPRNLLVDEDKDLLYYVSDAEDKDYALNTKVYCPDSIKGYADSKTWLSNHIPKVSIDFSQNGNIRKGLEVEAMFKCIIINCFLDGIFNRDINKVLTGNESDDSSTLDSVGKDIEISTFQYDFENMANPYDETHTFRSCLTDIQKVNTILIKSLISACSYHINDNNQKKDANFFSLLTEEVGVSLGNINKKYKNKIKEYDDEIKKLKNDKAKRSIIDLKIEERDLNTFNLVHEKQYANIKQIFQIYRISSDSLSTFKKKKISDFCQDEVESISLTLLEAKELTNLSRRDYVKINLKKTTRRLLREATRELRIEQLNEYFVAQKNGVEFVLDAKYTSQAPA